jgi:flagellar hook-basal body complex protein FliE
MSTPGIENVGFLPSAGLEALESRLSKPVSANFSTWLSGEVAKVNAQLLVADKQVQELALGRTQNLHDVMIALENARMSFQLMIQLRNRALEAYQDILRMQI